MTRILLKFLPSSCIKLSKREQLQGKLAKLKAHFEKLKTENWSINEREFYCDVALLPIAVRAENARTPGLDLHNFETFECFTDALKSEKLQNGRALFPLPRHKAHLVAADVRTIDGKISILILEPVSVVEDVNPPFMERYVRNVVPAMCGNLPENAKLTVLSLDVQQSTTDCRIFALSAASKLAKETTFLDELHADNLSDQLGTAPSYESPEIKDWSDDDLFDGSMEEFSSSLNNAIEIDEWRDDAPSDSPSLPKNAKEQLKIITSHKNVRVVDAHQLMPASFQKHTQAMSSLKASGDENSLQKPVNKKGDTLLSRFEKHAVVRHKLVTDSDEKGEPRSKLKQVKFNASIEDKRIDYLDRAIAYLDEAPKQDIATLLRDFNAAMAENKKENKKQASIAREVGPER